MLPEILRDPPTYSTVLTPKARAPCRPGPLLCSAEAPDHLVPVVRGLWTVRLFCSGSLPAQRPLSRWAWSLGKGFSTD